MKTKQQKQEEAVNRAIRDYKSRPSNFRHFLDLSDYVRIFDPSVISVTESGEIIRRTPKGVYK